MGEIKIRHFVGRHFTGVELGRAGIRAGISLSNSTVRLIDSGRMLG